MNRLRDTLDARLGLVALMVLGLVALQFSACVHEPTMIVPNPMDTIPADTDTVVIDTTVGLRACDPDTVYFQQDVLPILLANCATGGCHNATSSAAGVILDSYENTIKTTAIKLSDPASSDIYARITTIDPNLKMPIPPAPPLLASEADIILKWIEQGAQDLVCDKLLDCDTVEVSYANVVQPILIERKCISCHDDDTPAAGLSFHTHDLLVIVANNGTLLGSIEHDPSYAKMPPNAPKMPACEIAQIAAWINAGTPDN
ncbi:MAG: c-type cytochrome domain-containing protein [Bacteroidota bacterium]